MEHLATICFPHPRPFCTFKRTPDVLRARGTLFWPKIARELTKSDGTRTIRSEIARGIVSNRSRGPEMDKMRVLDPGVTPGYPRGTPGSKTLILSISGPRDLLETIPRAISDRMVSVPSDFVKQLFFFVFWGGLVCYFFGLVFFSCFSP